MRIFQLPVVLIDPVHGGIHRQRQPFEEFPSSIIASTTDDTAETSFWSSSPSAAFVDDNGTSGEASLPSSHEASNEEVAMYARPVLSAAAISKDGQHAVAITGHTLLIWKWILPSAAATATAAGAGAERNQEGGAAATVIGEWRPDLRTMLEPGVKYMSVIIIRNNLEIVVAGSDGMIYVIHRATGDVMTTMVHTPIEDEEGEGQGRRHHASYYAVNSIRVSPRESFLATCGGSGQVMIWDAVTKRRLGTLQVGSQRYLIFDDELPQDYTDDEDEMGGGEGDGGRGSSLPARIASLLRPESRELLDFEACHANAVVACDFSSDDRRLAIGGEAQVVEIWSIARLKPKGEEDCPTESHLRVPSRRLMGHEGGINAIAFSPSAHLLASLDVRGMLLLWDPSTGDHLASILAHRMVGTTLAFIPGEVEMILTAGLDRFIKIWDLESVVDAEEEMGLSSQKGQGDSSSIASRRSIASSSTASSMYKKQRKKLKELEPLMTLRGHDSGVTQTLLLRRGAAGLAAAAKQRRKAVKEQAASSSSLSAATPSTFPKDPSLSTLDDRETTLSSSTSTFAAAAAFPAATSDTTIPSPSLYLLSSGVDQRLSFWTLHIKRPILHAFSLSLHAYGHGQQPSHSAIKLAIWMDQGRRLATCAYQDPHIHVWEMEGERMGELCLVLRGLNRAVTAMKPCTSSSSSVPQSKNLKEKNHHHQQLQQQQKQQRVMVAAGDEGGKVCLWYLDDVLFDDEEESLTDLAAASAVGHRPSNSSSSSTSSSAPVMYTKANLRWFKREDGEAGVKGGRGGLLDKMVMQGGGSKRREAGLFWEAERTWTNQHESPIRSVTFVTAVGGGNEGGWLVSCDAVSMIRVLNIQTKEVVHTIHGGEAPTGPVYLITGGSGQGQALAESENDEKKKRIRRRKEGVVTLTTSSSSNRRWTEAIDPFLITHTRQEILLWYAKTGQIYARQRVCNDEQDGIKAMAYLPSSTATSLMIRIAALTNETGPFIWDIPMPSSSGSSCQDGVTGVNASATIPSVSPLLQDLRPSLLQGGTNDVILLLENLAFCTDGRNDGHYLVAWGPTEVALWGLEEAGGGEGKEVELAPGEEERVDEDGGVGAEEGKESPPFPNSYRLLAIIPVGSQQKDEEFMKGPIAVTVVPISSKQKVLRVATKERWVIDISGIDSCKDVCK